MCGLAGILASPNAAPPGEPELARMVAMLGHRGPDAFGFYRAPRIGLAHARLSIVGLADGFQPIRNEDATVWISFNGEIFNHHALRNELIACGHHFYTHADTEVIVHAFEEWGERAWTRLNGQFAFALWEERRRRLWLVRDAMGVLPLFYATVGGHLVFASEAKALFAGGRIRPCFDGARLTQVFSHWSVAPHGGVFSGVEEVPAGTALSIDENLTISAHAFAALDFAAAPEFADFTLKHASEELGIRLHQAVRARLRADVPVGVYLSGGLDSSMIAALASWESAEPLHSFSVRFSDRAFDETDNQRAMVDFLGSTHHEIICGPADIQDGLPEVVWHAETPLLRTAPAPLLLLSRLVRDSGIKVVLSGEGADELLAGYDVFKEDQVRRFWARRPDSVTRPRLFARLHPFAAARAAKDSRLWQQFFGQGLGDLDDPFYAHRPRWRNTAWTQRLLAADLRAAADATAREEAIAATLPEGWLSWSPLGRAQAVEIAAFLTPYLLASQGDRVAMAHGVEVRYPFLDPAVVALAAGLPARTKRLGLKDKLALRRLARELVPAQIAQAAKRPYRAPTTPVLFGRDAPDYARELLSPPMLARYGLLDAKAVGALAARAHASDGRMAGEREEMGLIGALTLQLLAHDFQDAFTARVRAQEARARHIPVPVRVARL